MAEISKDKETECKQVFDLFDFDKDGFIACDKVRKHRSRLRSVRAERRTTRVFRRVQRCQSRLCKLYKVLQRVLY